MAPIIQFVFPHPSPNHKLCPFGNRTATTPNYISRVMGIFEGVYGSPYFTIQWFYRVKDTVIKNCSDLIDNKGLTVKGNVNVNEERLANLMQQQNEQH
ncbi:hypothetical protein LguiB_012699 [Lonicera macranthoides]